MKRKIRNLLFGLIFLIGFFVLTYPTIADQWNTYRQSTLISEYKAITREFTPEDFSMHWRAARKFNKTIKENTIFSDTFDTNDILGEDVEAQKEMDSQVLLADTLYGKVLNLSGTGVMGYISIPKINIQLAIYHGTAEDILQKGVGHLNGSKLPIGGESNHTILAAHRGLPSARLFTDIDQLMIGDRIYLHILDETLAYEVDQVLPMVDRNDQEALEEALKINEGEDQVTLFTCTPYGVNTHRLLVRGSRVPYEGEEDIEKTPTETMLASVQNYYMLYVILGLSITFLVILIMRFLLRPRKKSRKGESE